MDLEIKVFWKREFLIFRRHLIDGIISFIHLFLLSLKLTASLAKLLMFGLWGKKNKARPAINDPISEGHIVENTFISNTAKGPWAP